MNTDTVRGRDELPANPTWMATRLRIRRIGKGFRIDGRAIAMDEIVTTDLFCAQGLIAMGKAEMVEP